MELDAGKQGKYVSVSELNDYTLNAFVSTEDKRFYRHHGLDLKRIGSALIKNIFSGSYKEGASTITQQLIKNVTQYDDITIQRKLVEIFRALEFEKNNTKSQILELYLNMIYLGSGCGGVETAAEYYFGKPAKDLTAAESACIIAITNNPSLYNPK